MKHLILSLLAVIFLLTSCSKDPQDPGLLVPLTVKEDPTIPSIEVNNVLLHSYSIGNVTDPLLVVIHGGPGADHRALVNFQDLADEGMHVVFYDQRGSGLSERLGVEGYSEVQVFIDELQGVIEHYRNDDEQDVILAGHSWGAMLATAYVNQNPDKVQGLILAEPGGFTWEQTEAYISRTRKLVLTGEVTNDFVYQDQILTGDDHNGLDYKFSLSTAGDILTGDTEAPPYWRYGAVCNSASIDLAINNPEQLDFTENLSAFTTKVLFTYSQLNSSYGKEHAQLVSAPLPNVELAEILDCGHEMPHFGWNNLLPIIQKYLTEIL